MTTNELTIGKTKLNVQASNFTAEFDKAKKSYETAHAALARATTIAVFHALESSRNKTMLLRIAKNFPRGLKKSSYVAWFNEVLDGAIRIDGDKVVLKDGKREEWLNALNRKDKIYEMLLAGEWYDKKPPSGAKPTSVETELEKLNKGISKFLDEDEARVFTCEPKLVKEQLAVLQKLLKEFEQRQ